MGLLFDNANLPISNTNPLPVMMTGGGGSSGGNTTVTAVPQDGTVPAGAPFSGNVNGAILFSIDTTGYESITVQLYGTFVATVTYECSNDNTNWVLLQGTNIANIAGTQVQSNDNTAIVRVFPAQAKFLRARISAYTSGTVNAIPLLRSATPDYGSTFVQGGSIALAASSANIGVIGGVNVTSMSGGLVSVGRIVSSSGSAHSAVLKGSAGRLYKLSGFNAATAVRWLKFYNLSSAPVVGTSSVFFAVPLPVGYFDYGTVDIGHYFSVGVAYGLVTGALDADTTPVGAGEILNLNMWFA